MLIPLSWPVPSKAIRLPSGDHSGLAAQPEKPGVGSLSGVPEPSAFARKILQVVGDQKAIVCPSGHQDGSYTLSPSGSEISIPSEPSGSITQILPPESDWSEGLLFAKAIRAPSGDQAGAWSKYLEFVVRLTGLEPFGFTVQISSSAMPPLRGLALPGPLRPQDRRLSCRFESRLGRSSRRVVSA